MHGENAERRCRRKRRIQSLWQKKQKVAITNMERVAVGGILNWWKTRNFKKSAKNDGHSLFGFAEHTRFPFKHDPCVGQNISPSPNVYSFYIQKASFQCRYRWNDYWLTTHIEYLYYSNVAQIQREKPCRSWSYEKDREMASWWVSL